MEMIEQAFESLSQYCLKEEYKGWDLFDGLNSKLFKWTAFYNSRLFRLVWIQLFKRSPLNFRRITLVAKDYNPKGLALFAAGLLLMDRVDEAEVLLGKLKKMDCSGYQGIAWGYNFDWEARAFYVPVGKPNMVTTVFIANAFLDHYEITGDHESLTIADRACEFILNTLILHEDEETLCLGYIPGENTRVHNANMLGAALLGKVFFHNKKSGYYQKSKKAMRYSVQALNSDYSWPYGERYHHQFIDNFHTGFNLVALKEWMEKTSDYTWQGEIEKAHKYFINTFWLNDGCPKYYHNSLYPIDIHCAAQGIITCLELKEYDGGSINLAEKIAKWAITNFQDKKGYFYYQKTNLFTNKIPYIRWSQAWMFYSLALLLKERNSCPPPKLLNLNRNIFKYRMVSHFEWITKMSLDVKLITSRDELAVYGSEWNNLLLSSAANTIFLTWEWVGAWLDTVSPDAKLFVVIVRDKNSKLIAVAPFYCSYFRFCKLIKYNYLRGLGDCNSGAEYPDIIIEKGKEQLALPAIIKCVFTHRRLWQCAWFPNIAGWTDADHRFERVFSGKISFWRKRKFSCSSIILPTTIDIFMQSLSGSFRAIIRRQERRLIKEHKIEFVICNKKNMEELLEDLFRLHQSRWQSVGQQGSFVRRPPMEKFYRCFVPKALKRGWLGLFGLRIDGIIKAVQFGYVYDDKFFQLQEGFCPEGKGGIGNVLRFYVINWCISSGLREYDFLGGHTSHKHNWGAEERMGQQLFLGKNCLENKLLSIREFWPTGRFIDQ